MKTFARNLVVVHWVFDPDGVSVVLFDAGAFMRGIYRDDQRATLFFLWKRTNGIEASIQRRIWEDMIFRILEDYLRG